MIKSEPPLEVGEHLEIHVFKNRTESIFSVRILETSEVAIYVNQPLSNRQPLILEPGTKILVFLNRYQKSRRFFSKVLGTTMIEGKSVFQLELPRDQEQNERRSAYRLNCSFPVAYQLSGTCSDPLSATDRGELLNLSTDGLSFKIDSIEGTKLATGSVFNVKIDLCYAHCELKTKAIVLEHRNCLQEPGGEVIVGKFLGIQPVQKEAIILHSIRFQQFNISSRNRN